MSAKSDMTKVSYIKLINPSILTIIIAIAIYTRLVGASYDIIALEGTAPFGTVVGELGIMMSYPLAVTFFNNFGADFVKMFGFNYQENAESLIKRIEELVEEKRREELKRKELERELGTINDGWLSRLRKWFRG